MIGHRRNAYQMPAGVRLNRCPDVSSRTLSSGASTSVVAVVDISKTLLIST